MRRRDVHMVLAEIGMTFCCVAVSLLSSFVILSRLRAVDCRLDEVDAGLDSVERSCADALSAARAATESALYASSSSSAPSNVVSAPVLLGRGQTRSRTHRYVYEDFWTPEGGTQRRYILRFPLGDYPAPK